MKKLLLEYYQSPGDTVVSTAAVHSMMIDYHKDYKISVKGVGANDTFKNSPFISWDLKEFDQVIKMENPLIDSSHLPNHFLESYCVTLSKAIEKPVKLKFFHPMLQLSKEERDYKPRIEEITGTKTKYWVLSLPGRKNDYTNKRWPVEYMQEVVNHFRGKITFVQTGENGHSHIPLNNTINEIGKTDLRQLIRLVWNAQGVITGESLCHHIAAGLKKPCVTIASGWLPKSWVYYPTGVILSKHGSLPCCKERSCWRARTVPLNDGDEKDKSLCKLPMLEYSEPIPKCMAMITPKEVIAAIEDYYYGGILSFS